MNENIFIMLCDWFDLSCVFFHTTPDVFDRIYTLRLRRKHCSIDVSIIVSEPCYMVIALSYCLVVEHKWVLLVCKHLLYWLQQISTNEVNVRILVDISIKHYQIVNARKLMHPQTITETFYVHVVAITCVWIHTLSISSQTSLNSIIRLSV